VLREPFPIYTGENARQKHVWDNRVHDLDPKTLDILDNMTSRITTTRSPDIQITSARSPVPYR